MKKLTESEKYEEQKRSEIALRIARIESNEAARKFRESIKEYQEEEKEKEANNA